MVVDCNFDWSFVDSAGFVYFAGYKTRFDRYFGHYFDHKIDPGRYSDSGYILNYKPFYVPEGLSSVRWVEGK